MWWKVWITIWVPIHMQNFTKPHWDYVCDNTRSSTRSILFTYPNFPSYPLIIPLIYMWANYKEKKCNHLWKRTFIKYTNYQQLVHISNTHINTGKYSCIITTLDFLKLGTARMFTQHDFFLHVNQILGSRPNKVSYVM